MNRKERAEEKRALRDMEARIRELDIAEAEQHLQAANAELNRLGIDAGQGK